jgi:hypothetical protein
MNRSRGLGEALILPRALLKRIGTIELAVAIQFLSPALLMIGPLQPLRLPIRILQYGSSLAFLLFYHRRWLRNGWPPGGKLLVLCVALMLAGLLQPSTPLLAGIAQIVFQICIIAPLFWAGVMVRDSQRLRRLLWAILLVNAISSGVGLLQVYYPGQFLPGEISPSFRENVNMMTYEGTGGRAIMRPPGLTDAPGGAASAGLLCGLLGLILATNRHDRPLVRIFALACCLMGITILYLTFVRSLTLALLASFLAVSVLRNRRVRQMKFLRVGLLAAAAVAAAFWLAASIGGEAVTQRFLQMKESGLVESYQSQRGIFLTYTFDYVIPEYPVGAGVGRWGMMCNYFCDPNDLQRQPFYVEIQLTGWVFDGGVPLLLGYLAAIAAALWYSFRVATRHPDPQVALMAKCILAVQIALSATILSGPTFNNLLGSQFWLLGGALYGTCAGGRRPGVLSQSAGA